MGITVKFPNSKDAKAFAVDASARALDSFDNIMRAIDNVGCYATSSIDDTEIVENCIAEGTFKYVAIRH